MNYLLDTNIISEVRKGAKCDPNVAAWYASIDDADIYLSVLVLGEIRKGIERARSSNSAQARALEKWLTPWSGLSPIVSCLSIRPLRMNGGA